MTFNWHNFLDVNIRVHSEKSIYFFSFVITLTETQKDKISKDN
jgi:hypothetical protein